MFIPSDGYSLKVRAKPRVQVSNGFPQRGRRRKVKAVKEEQERNPQQELIWQAFKNVHEVKEALKGYKDLFHRLQQIVTKCLDLKFTDNDRRLVNKQYQAVLRQIDSLVESTLVQEVQIFSPKEKGLEVPISLDGEERMHIALMGLDLDSVRLRETRVDSIVYSRKVEKVVENVNARISSLEKYIESKFAALEVKRESVGLEPPDFLNGKNGQDVHEDFEDEEEEDFFEDHSPQLQALKERQQRAARAKGRQSALLINTKV